MSRDKKVVSPWICSLQARWFRFCNTGFRPFISFSIAFSVIFSRRLRNLIASNKFGDDRFLRIFQALFQVLQSYVVLKMRSRSAIKHFEKLKVRIHVWWKIFKKLATFGFCRSKKLFEGHEANWECMGKLQLRAKSQCQAHDFIGEKLHYWTFSVFFSHLLYIVFVTRKNAFCVCRSEYRLDCTENWFLINSTTILAAI